MKNFSFKSDSMVWFVNEENVALYNDIIRDVFSTHLVVLGNNAASKPDDIEALFSLLDSWQVKIVCKNW